MPHRVLLLYLSRAFLNRTIIGVAVLVALLEILGLLEKITPILSRDLGFAGIVYYALLKLPALLGEALPLGTMIGAMLMLLQMNLRNELTGLKAAGLSHWRLYRLLAPVALGVGLFGIALQTYVTPIAELSLTQWWSETTPISAIHHRNLWFRLQNTVVHIGAIDPSAREIEDITTYQRSPSGALITRFGAKNASYSPRGWLASSANCWHQDRGAFTMTQLGQTIVLPPKVTPQMLLQLSALMPILRPSELLAVLRHDAPASLPIARYEMALISPFFLPISLFAMLLLTAPIIPIPPRAGTKSIRPVISLASGFGFLILQGLLRALGSAGTIPVSIAVAATPILALLIGGSLLFKLEEK